LLCNESEPIGGLSVLLTSLLLHVTAAELRVLMSDALARVTLDVKKEPVAVRRMLDSLSQMVSIAECDVFGYLGLDNELVVLVTTAVSHPSALQVN